MSMARLNVEQLEADVGRRLRDIRIAAGLTQNDLARTANLSRGAIRNIERGSGTTLETLIKVLRAVDRDDWLLTLEAPTEQFNPLDLLDNPRPTASGRSRSRRTRRSGPAQVA